MPLQLVFIHGWGFDAHSWDALAAQLPQFDQHRVELGFFNENPVTEIPDVSGKILIGHSLGLVHGIKQQGWKGWVAINSFSRFVANNGDGCVPATILREMRLRLQKNPAQCLQDFYQMIGAEPHAGTPNMERQRDGLDELRDSDVNGVLSSMNVPGLVLAGGIDPLVPEKASQKLGGYAGQFMLNEGGGHLLPQTDPAWCAKAIADFAASDFG
jgi:pimeloyl-[acyl-carrier protein] methyl ester esterase